MRLSFPASILALLSISAVALAEDAPAPTPTPASAFSDTKQPAGEGPFGEAGAAKGPMTLDEAIAAEETNNTAAKPATLATPAAAQDDPFADNKGTLDPLARPANAPNPAAPAIAPNDVANPFNDSSMPAASMMSAPKPASPGAPPAAATTTTEEIIPWAPSLDAAIQQAKLEKKGVLLVFSGDTPTWSGFATALNSDTVASRIQKNFIPVKVDLKSNDAVAKKFSVKRAPYIVVLNKFGYTAGHVQPSSDPNSLLALLNPFMTLG
ncbi:thioredoxin family protein [Candidatus Sumerlaeota bacterium]|nr:thioredoxin family protein [Candidatus Sumerlaeota bacterium]